MLSVLVTMGQLATVAGTQLRGNVAEILPLIIDVIQDASSPAKRLVAVRGPRVVCCRMWRTCLVAHENALPPQGLRLRSLSTACKPGGRAA